MSDNRGSVYWDADINRWVYRASSLGNCIRALVMERCGITPEPPPKQILRAYEKGVKLEQPILFRLRDLDGGKCGWKMLDRSELHAPYNVVDESGQVVVEIPVGSKALVRCHPDGIGECFKARSRGSKSKGSEWDGPALGERRVVEAKSASEGFYQQISKEMPELYKWQYSVEMVGTGLGGLYVIGVKKAEFDEDDDPDTWIHKVVVEYHDEPYYSKSEIIQRVLKVEKLAREYEEGGGFPECSYKQWPCGMYRDGGCVAGKKGSGGESGGDVPKLEWQDKDREREFKLWIGTWRKYAQSVKSGQEKVKEARENILRLVEGEVENLEDLTPGLMVVENGVKVSRREGKMVVSEKKLKEKGVSKEEVSEKGKDYWQVEMEREK